jgi:hypothetical protein
MGENGERMEDMAAVSVQEVREAGQAALKQILL